MSVADLVARRLAPRAIVALAGVRAPARAAAAVRRALGRRGRVVVFVAFDDPSSAVAVAGLQERVAGRAVDLVVEPVVARGIPGDPAADAKRRYAVLDAGRLARRAGLTLSRDAPLPPGETAFLAEWAAGVPHSAQRTAFCAAAMRELWFASAGAVDRERLAALWREHLGTTPRPGSTAGAERRMRRRGPYDTPAAVLGGQWFFAHERLDQIAGALDDLGWTRGAA